MTEVADAAAAVSSFAAAAVGAPSFKDVIATLQAHAATHPALVATLAAQLRAALAALPGKAGAAAASAPAAAVDLAAATCTLPNVACLAPRGRFDLVLLPDALAFVSKGVASLLVPFAHLQHVLLLEKPPPENAGPKAAAQRTVYFMLPLASDKPADFGKQKLSVLLLSVKSDEAMAAVHPQTKAPLEGGAPRVVASALSAATGIAVEESGACGFSSARGAVAILAHVKVNPGFLFPMRSGFAFVERPPLFLPASAWDGVSLGRAAGTSQTFDLVVGATEFGMISRDEMPALQQYVASRRKVVAKRAAAAAAAAAEGGEGVAAAAGGAADDSDGSSDEDFAADGSGDSGGSGSESSDDGSGDDDVDVDGADGAVDAATPGGTKRPPPSDSDDDSDDGAAWGMHPAETPAKQARAE